MFKPVRIIVHHSLTTDSGTVSWGAIRKYHVEKMGMVDIGYHAGVELVTNQDNSYYEALMGRMWDVQGAHTRGHNHNSLGICFIGNYDVEALPDAMLDVGVKVIALWMKLFNIPASQIHRHHTFADYKTCPGTLFPFDVLINRVSAV